MAVSYVSSKNPQVAAQNQRDRLTYRGDQLGGAADAQMAAEEARRQQTAGYLNNIYDPMAQGQGGYSPDEAAAIQGNTGSYGEYFDPAQMSADVAQGNSQILMSPEERQAIITGAGITAGNQNQAAVDSLERSARAAGSSPMGVAAYRSRMARQSAGDIADAMTQARVAAGNAEAGRANTALQNTMQQNQYNTSTGTGINQAKDVANSGRATTVANTRLGQQENALNYYTGQNTQANQNENAAADRAAGIYGTQGSLSNQATGLQQATSQNPSTFQKVMGGVGGALSAVAPMLADGGVVTKPTMAVVGEDGPEAVVPLGNRPGAKVRPSAMSGIGSYMRRPMPMQRPITNYVG
jgi:hypothetical protein